jgi:integrase
VLTPDEFAAVWRACGQFPTFGPFVRCLIVSGQRRGQLARLHPSMIDRDRQTITWPPALMKTGKEHTIPYGPLMGEIMSSRLSTGLVLPNAAGTPFCDEGHRKIRLDEVCPIPHWTIHDLRRTWATISAEELDTPPHIIEAVLAHQSGTAVGRIYNRARYIEPMRKALVAFEEWLQTLLSNTENTHARELSGVHQE